MGIFHWHFQLHWIKPCHAYSVLPAHKLSQARPKMNPLWIRAKAHPATPSSRQPCCSGNANAESNRDKPRQAKPARVLKKHHWVKHGCDEQCERHRGLEPDSKPVVCQPSTDLKEEEEDEETKPGALAILADFETTVSFNHLTQPARPSQGGRELG